MSEAGRPGERPRPWEVRPWMRWVVVAAGLVLALAKVATLLSEYRPVTRAEFLDATRAIGLVDSLQSVRLDQLQELLKNDLESLVRLDCLRVRDDLRRAAGLRCST